MRRIALPALAVVVVALAFEVAYGVSLGDALLYLGYELGFVVLPGWAAYRVLSRRSRWPAASARDRLGARLRPRDPRLHGDRGHGHATVAGRLSASGRGRGGGDHLAARPRQVPSERDSTRPRVGPARLGWLIAAVCIVAIAYIALAYFPSSPLPGTESVSYFPDYPRWIALAADAKNHWPIMDPSVVGEPLPYHYFVNIHLAAASQVTGLGLPLLYLRLFIFPLVVVSVLLLVVAGRALARSWSVGLIAACLAFFVGELRLDASNTFLAHTPFFGLFFTFLFRSPSFLLGLVLFVPLVILVGERIRARPERILAGEWILIALFMVGASDAKVTILPLLIAALGSLRGMELARPHVGYQPRCGPRRAWLCASPARSGSSSTGATRACFASTRSRT